MWEGWSKAAEQVPAKRASSGPNPASLEALPPEWELPKGPRQQKSRKALAFQAITPQRFAIQVTVDLTLKLCLAVR